MGWLDAKRHLEYQGVEAEEGRDLDGTQPFAVQAKCWARNPSIGAIEEIVPTDEYPIPVAILKRSKVGQKPLEVAVMPLALFELLLTQYLNVHGKSSLAVLYKMSVQYAEKQDKELGEG